MPQIYLKVSPDAQQRLAQHGTDTAAVGKILDQSLAAVVAEVWDVPFHDIAFSAEDLVYTRGEADFQLEVRYTAGTDEYRRGKPFDPDDGEREKLADRIQKTAEARFAGLGYTISVWIKPSYKSVFKAANG